MKMKWVLALSCSLLMSSASFADTKQCIVGIYPKGKPSKLITQKVELSPIQQVTAVGADYCVELQAIKTAPSSDRFSNMENFYFAVTDGQPVEETINGQKTTRCVFSNRTLALVHTYISDLGPIFIEVNGTQRKISKSADLYVLDCRR